MANASSLNVLSWPWGLTVERYGNPPVDSEVSTMSMLSMRSSKPPGGGWEVNWYPQIWSVKNLKPPLPRKWDIWWAFGGKLGIFDYIFSTLPVLCITDITNMILEYEYGANVKASQIFQNTSQSLVIHIISLKVFLCRNYSKQWFYLQVSFSCSNQDTILR